MPPYTPLPSGAGSGPSSPRRSVSFRDRFTGHGRRRSQVPDPDEMDRAFDDPGDDDDDEHDAHEGHQLLPSSTSNTPLPSASAQRTPPMPGDYDFDRDYFLPPPGSPPPFEDYSASNPAPGNSNGILPSEPVARPHRQRHFLGGILPLSFLPRQHAPAAGVGGGQSGVFANLSARPDGQHHDENDPNFANEDEQKDAPPSYQTALRDAVPPYWDTTVVLPSASSPFGPLSSSINGEDILIDGMGAGNFFGFFWNLIVSASFQFVGFLLTYVLHTTHAAKYGSRCGLGVTLVQIGFKVHLEALEQMKNVNGPKIDPVTGKFESDLEGEAYIASFGPTWAWPQKFTLGEDWGGHGEEIIVHNVQEAESIAHKSNHTLADMLGMQSVQERGRVNEWFAFMMMTVGWFLILASIGGWWRVKRFEAKLRQAQKESERAQRAARGSLDELHPDEGEDPTPTRAEPGPTELAYYTSAFTQVVNGARELQRGFFGMRGARNRDSGSEGAGLERGDTLFASGNEDEQELLAAQGYGLEPMARSHTRTDSDPTSPTARRGLWT